MTNLVSKMSTLFAETINLLEPIKMVSHKWIIINRTQKKLKSFHDINESFSLAFAKVDSKIKTLLSYQQAKDAFDQNIICKNLQIAAGFWGTFESIFYSILSSTIKFHRNRWVNNKEEAVSKLQKYIHIIENGILHFKISARLIGVKISAKQFEFPDKIKILRLNKRQLNSRHPIIHPEVPINYDHNLLDLHQTELQLSIDEKFDPRKANSYFEANNVIQNKSYNIFLKVLDSIFIIFKGQAKIVDFKMQNNFFPFTQGIPFNDYNFIHPNSININARNFRKCIQVYNHISATDRIDNILNRSLRRFILGRQRRDIFDKLVDYVIALEAILLTYENQPITQELSYRFSLNGSTLIYRISKTNPKIVFKKLQCAYSIRSLIVHGGIEQACDKSLKKANFKNIEELCDYLEDNYRLIILWLFQQQINSRPYREKLGWEKLIWPNKLL